MATQLTRVVGLAVGQGMGHLIEIYKGTTTPTPTTPPDHLALVDFGGNRKWADGAANYIVGKLKLQATPTFDLLAVSHQDSDHNSLLQPLLDAIKTANVKFSVTTYANGGMLWSPKNKAKVTAFVAAAQSAPPITWSTKYLSHYDYDPIPAYATLGDTAIRALVAQHEVASGGDDIIKNASSLVLVFDDGAGAVVLPGDSTWQTMSRINQFYTAWKGSPKISTVWGLEVPHHGALRTAAESYLASSAFADLDTEVFKTFIKNMNPKIVWASAGYMTTHGHPVREVLDLFNDYAKGPTTNHTNVAYVFDAKGVARGSRYEAYDTTLQIWTTLAGIASGAEWRNVTVELKKSSLGESSLSIAYRTFAELSGTAPATSPSSVRPPPPTAAAPTEAERARAAAVAALPRRR